MHADSLSSFPFNGCVLYHFWAGFSTGALAGFGATLAGFGAGFAESLHSLQGRNDGRLIEDSALLVPTNAHVRKTTLAADAERGFAAANAEVRKLDARKAKFRAADNAFDLAHCIGNRFFCRVDRVSDCGLDAVPNACDGAFNAVKHAANS
mgnify:CR=1 FL=1